MPTWDNPDATSSRIPLTATALPQANVNQLLDEQLQEAPQVPPGLLRIGDLTRRLEEPLAHATQHQLELDAKESGHELEDEPTVKEQLEFTWDSLKITNRERRHRILTRAREIVANYIEAYQKYDVIEAKIRDRIVICTAVRIAKTYVERRNAKTSPEANTPTSVNSSLIDVTPSKLGLFTQPSEEAMERKLHSRKGKKGVALTAMTEDDEDVARPMASTTTGATKRVVHPPAPKDWYDRVSAQRARNKDLRKHDKSKIPDQGVVFNDHYP